MKNNNATDSSCGKGGRLGFYILLHKKRQTAFKRFFLSAKNGSGWLKIYPFIKEARPDPGELLVI
ncbi:hypothetical protein [Paenibacillus sp. DMB20]|uniref:hypothetical protein n=1 Tax=Paenibacillus sp. DMB20 TaxID=1642570 RepID=UPI00128B9D22|nr:hypothetical protein [Paenibacillus sp. DMB20]